MGEGPGSGEVERMYAGMQAELARREGGRTCEREGERETMMSAFPSGLVTWPFPGKQTGNRLSIKAAPAGGGRRRGGASPFPLCCLLSKTDFMFATRWSLSGIAFLRAQEYDSGREGYLLL